MHMVPRLLNYCHVISQAAWTLINCSSGHRLIIMLINEQKIKEMMITS